MVPEKKYLSLPLADPRRQGSGQSTYVVVPDHIILTVMIKQEQTRDAWVEKGMLPDFG
jgi:hypothetical protein